MTTPPPAYLALPAGSGPGVLVFHAWWGLTPFFTGLCDRLAAAGYVALAPDLFAGETADTSEGAERLTSLADRKAVNKIARAAIDALAAHPAVAGPHLGAIGFSYGAAYALEAARLRPALVHAVALFYGAGGGRFDKTRASFLGHYAEHDEWESARRVQGLEKRIRDAGRPVTFHTYAGTAHWFFEDNRPEFDPAAAALAWDRTLAFLAAYLT